MPGRSKTVQNRASRARAKNSGVSRRTSVEPWNLDAEFPLHLVDYTHSRPGSGEFHIHDVLEIGWCRSGAGVFMIEDKAYNFRPGDVYVISNLEAHYASPANAPSEWSFLFVDPARLLGAAADPVLFDLSACCGEHFNNCFRPEQRPRLCEAFLRIRSEFQQRGPHYRDAIKANVVELLVDLKRGHPKAASPAPARSYDQMRTIEPALKRISRDYAQPLALPGLARLCFMSSSHFRRVFTSQMRVSPQDYLLGYRIAMAACLLTGTAAPVTQIAFDVGFQTLSSFNRQFQKRKGCSPREWRNGKGTA